MRYLCEFGTFLELPHLLVQAGKGCNEFPMAPVLFEDLHGRGFSCMLDVFRDNVNQHATHTAELRLQVEACDREKETYQEHFISRN